MSSEEKDSLALAGLAVALCVKRAKSASGSKRGRKLFPLTFELIFHMLRFFCHGYDTLCT